MPTLKSAAKKILPISVWNAFKRGNNCLKFAFSAIFKTNCSLPFLVVCVGQACNFKCRDCANFCPIASKETLRYNLDSIQGPLRVIFRSVSKIDHLQIQGGEPFLYADLGRLISFLRTFPDKVKTITVATNGSVIPSDELMMELQRNHVSVRISDYGVLPEQRNKLVEKCNRFHVDNVIYDFASGQSLWYHTGGPRFHASESAKSLKRKFYSCAFQSCFTLERGELSRCSRATNSYAIQGFQRKAGDYLKVEDSPHFRNALARYVLLARPMTACSYCHGTSDDHMIPAAIQMKSREEMRNLG